MYIDSHYKHPAMLSLDSFALLSAIRPAKSRLFNDLCKTLVTGEPVTLARNVLH